MPCSTYWPELILFLFFFPSVLYSTALNNIVIEKICFLDGPPPVGVVCTNKGLIAQAADMNTVRTFIRILLPLIVSIIAGTWRDRTGLSKPLIVIANIGEILAAAITLVASFFWNLSPWYMVIPESIIAGLLGSGSLLSIAVICYVTDVISEEKITFRMAAVVSVILGACNLANLTSGYLLALLDYNIYFTAVITIYVINIFFACILLKETRRDAEVNTDVLSSLKLLKVAFRPKTNGIVAWLIVLANGFGTAPFASEDTITFSYLQSTYKLTIMECGLFGAYKTFVSIISAIIMPYIMQNKLKWTNFTIALVCTFCTTMARIFLAYARTIWQLYLFASFDFLRITFLAVLRSLLSIAVPNNEMGTYFSLVTIIDAVLQLVSLPIYDTLYSHTFLNFPGAFFCISAIFYLFAFCVIGVAQIKYIEKPSNANERLINASDSTEEE